MRFYTGLFPIFAYERVRTIHTFRHRLLGPQNSKLFLHRQSNIVIVVTCSTSAVTLQNIIHLIFIFPTVSEGPKGNSELFETR